MTNLTWCFDSPTRKPRTERIKQLLDQGADPARGFEDIKTRVNLGSMNIDYLLEKRLIQKNSGRREGRGCEVAAGVFGADLDGTDYGQLVLARKNAVVADSVESRKFLLEARAKHMPS